MARLSLLLLLIVLLFDIGTTASSSLYEDIDDGSELNLTPDHLEHIVRESRQRPVLIEFYADWCEHCKSFAPQYVKVKNALQGIVKVVAINAGVHQASATQYNVQGLPTIKLITNGAEKTIEYREQSNAKDIIDFVMKEMRHIAQARLSSSSNGNRNRSGSDDKKRKDKTKHGVRGEGKVLELDDSNFDQVFESNVPVAVAFTAPWCGHCKNLKPNWSAAAKKLDGIFVLANVDATVNRVLASRYGIQGYPTIKIFKPGSRIPLDYSGGRTTNEIVTFLMNFADSIPKPKQILQITSEEVLHKICGDRLCFIAFLPNILDSTAAERNSQIDQLKILATTFVRRPLNFGWIEGGLYLDFESALGVNVGNYPTGVLVNFKNKGVINHIGSFDLQSLEQFIGAVFGRRMNPLPLPEYVPKLAISAEWDGNDAVKPIKQDDDIDIDISDIIGKRRVDEL